MDYIKHHPDGRGKGWELAWMGSLPGKRESTRFVGPHILCQRDILSGGKFPDVVAYGGWTFDDHDPEAFWNADHISIEHERVSPFGIPFGCVYSVNVLNLMFAGRNASVTHVGLSATRIMGTCALLGQAVGTAAALAVAKGQMPAELHATRIAELQTALEEDDVMLPGRWRKPSALTLTARPYAGSEALANGIDRCYDGKDNGAWLKVGDSCGYAWTTPSGLAVLGSSLTRICGVRGECRRWKGDCPRLEDAGDVGEKLSDRDAQGGRWTLAYEGKENFRRLCRVSFAPVEADALRLVVTETWGGEKAHVFGLDAF